MDQALKGERKAALLVFAAVAAVFFLAPPARFLQWDDAANLLNNDRWRGLSWERLSWMATTRWYGPWQPLSWFSWALDWTFFGLDPAAFRRTNVLLHALTSGLLVLCARKALPKAGLWGAVAAGLFFGLHPLRVESVVWITERRDVLSGVFSVASVLLWLEGRRRWSLVSFALAVLSKGTAVAVLPFLVALDSKSWKSMWPFALVASFAALMNLKGFWTGDLAVPSVPFAQRLVVALWGLCFYVWKTFVPFDLSPYYPLPSSLIPLIPGAVVAVLITIAASKRRELFAVWLSYAVALAPVSGLLQNGRQAAADRYSYLACLPFALLFGAVAGRSRAAVLSVAVLLSFLTVRQARVWTDDATLWERAVALAPDSYLPRSNLAQAYLAAGRRAEARAAFETVIALQPRDAEARVNLGTLVEGEDPARAEALYREALAMMPGSAQAAVDLAGLCARTKREKEAVSLLEGVVSRDPSFAAAHFNLGILYLRAGRKQDGLARLREAVRLEPSLAERLKR